MTQKPQTNGPISELLKSLPEQFSDSSVTIAQLKDAFSGRSYGIFLLVLALPNLVPIPAPGLSAILGIPLILFTFQLMLGLKTPWFPNWIGRRKIRRDHLKHICARIVPYLKRLENIITPRLGVLTRAPADRIVALLCLLLSLMIMLPVPFGNALPAFAICLLALGILQHDGLFIVGGTVVAVLSAIVVSAFIGGTAWSVSELLDL